MLHQLTKRHRAIEFKKFSNLIDDNVPEHLAVHVVVDNSSTHKTLAIHRWLVAHPRFELHFTPTSPSWMNLVERWFGELTPKWLRRRTHRDVKELADAISDWAMWNEDPRPYVWHKTAQATPRRHDRGPASIPASPAAQGCTRPSSKLTNCIQRLARLRASSAISYKRLIGIDQTY